MNCFIASNFIFLLLPTLKELNPTTYSGICKDIASKLAAEGKNVTFNEVVGEQLKDGGYGGIYGVGMAAQCPPRMVVMTYIPKDGEYTEHVAMCGKVIDI